MTVRLVDGTPVVTPSGELDLASAPDLKTAMSDALAPGPDHMIIDLLGVTFMDSSGIGALVAAKHDNPGTELTLVVGGGVVEKLIDITGLRDSFRLMGDLEAALSRPGSQGSSST